MYEIFKDKIFVGASKAIKSMKILVLESFRLYGRLLCLLLLGYRQQCLLIEILSFFLTMVIAIKLVKHNRRNADANLVEWVNYQTN